MAQNLEGLTSEQLLALAKKKEAEESQRRLETKGIEEFKQKVANAKSLSELYSISKNFAWQNEKVRRILNPSSGKRGRKSVKS